MSKSNEIDVSFIDDYAPRTRRTTRQMAKNMQEGQSKQRGRKDFYSPERPKRNNRRSKSRGKGNSRQ